MSSDFRGETGELLMCGPSALLTFSEVAEPDPPGEPSSCAAKIGNCLPIPRAMANARAATVSFTVTTNSEVFRFAAPDTRDAIWPGVKPMCSDFATMAARRSLEARSA